MAVFGRFAFLQILEIQVRSDKAPALAVAGNAPHPVECGQIKPLIRIAVSFVYAEKAGSRDVFRIEKADQVGGFAARFVEAIGDNFTDARRPAFFGEHHAPQRGEIAAVGPVVDALREIRRFIRARAGRAEQQGQRQKANELEKRAQVGHGLFGGDPEFSTGCGP